MKTAVSIPDDVFRDAERLAKRLRRSRSQLYADALREYVTSRSPDEIEATMNRVLDEIGGDAGAEYAFARRAMRRAVRGRRS
jgi:metal-responsive CopG/Arc/MetJ family transcriptional regulator